MTSPASPATPSPKVWSSAACQSSADQISSLSSYLCLTRALSLVAAIQPLFSDFGAWNLVFLWCLVFGVSPLTASPDKTSTPLRIHRQTPPAHSSPSHSPHPANPPDSLKPEARNFS